MIVVCNPCPVSLSSPSPCLRPALVPRLDPLRTRCTQDRAFSSLNHAFTATPLALVSVYKHPEQLGSCGPESRVTFTKMSASHPPQTCSRPVLCCTFWRTGIALNSEDDSIIPGKWAPPGLSPSLWKRPKTLSIGRDLYLPPALSILITGHSLPLMREEPPQRRQVAPEHRPRRARARWAGRTRGPGGSDPRSCGRAGLGWAGLRGLG